MPNTKSKAFVTDLLSRSNVSLDGSNPWDIHVHDDRFYDRVLSQGTLGVGEAYMDGWWDADNLDETLYRGLVGDIPSSLPLDPGLIWSIVRGKLFNMQRARVSEVGEKHYDIGNDLYSRMLDKRMIYSCAYWEHATTLDAAQEAKLDLICRKVGLMPGMRILDIGSGWGGFLKFAAERYGVEGVGVTVSKEQAAYANANRDGLPIETKLMDYQALEGQFDRIISIGMFEHVGYKNYRPFMEKAKSLLRPGGLLLLHTIGGNISTTHGDPWTEKYIFPNGMLPSAKQIAAASEGLFVMEDWHNFGAYYDKTLMAWHANFEAAWPELEDKYGERFHRMWRYYLLLCAALFRARKIQLWQVVFSPNGVPGGYRSVR